MIEAIRSAKTKRLAIAALAVAGYYEERDFGEKYGDQALDVLEHLIGVDTARHMRRYLGRPLALHANEGDSNRWGRGRGILSVVANVGALA